MNIESRALRELRFRAWENYIKNLQFAYGVTFDWEKRVPIGISKAEHYAIAGNLLADIVKDNVQDSEYAVLLIPASMSPILLFNEGFEPSVNVDLSSGAYQAGELFGTPIVVEPALSDKGYFILIDVGTDKVVRIGMERNELE